MIEPVETHGSVRRVDDALIKQKGGDVSQLVSGPLHGVDRVEPKGRQLELYQVQSLTLAVPAVGLIAVTLPILGQTRNRHGRGDRHHGQDGETPPPSPRVP
jgi:hypothetical protein